MQWLRRQRQGDEGFTLIELLIVLVILPLVTAAIAMVLITTLKNQQGVQGKITDATAASTASAYYVRDLESAGSVTTAQSPAGSPAQCHASSLSGTISYLLGLQLQGTTTVVSYYELTPAQGAPELVRASCTNTGGSLTELSHEVLSDNISGTNPPAAVVSCINQTSPTTSLPVGVTCDPQQDWTFTYLVAPVTLNVTQGCPPPATSCAQYQYALTGDPVSNVPVPLINQPNGALTLLGTGSDIQFGTFFSGSNSVCSAGAIVLGSGYNNNGSSAAITGDGSDHVDSGTSSCPSSGSSGINIYNCRKDNSNGQPCSLSGSNTAVSGGVDVKPSPPVDLSAAVTDPELPWVAQHTVGSVSGIGSCLQTSSTMTCQPGVYANGLNLPSGFTVTFTPGDYQFGGSSNVTCNGFLSSLQTSLCIQSNDLVDFGTGHYTFVNGLDVVGSNTTLCGGGPSTSSCPSSSNRKGVFFYVKGGNTNLGNVNVGTNIQLAPLGSSDKFTGVLLWQDGSDNNSVVLASASSSLNTYGGTIYAPTAELSFYGFGNSISTGNIVASRISFPFGSNCNVTVQ